MREAVTEVVRKQLDTGIDVINDGEFSKPSFVTYIRDRLGGLEPSGTRPNAWLSSREAITFPEYYKSQEARRRAPSRCRWPAPRRSPTRARRR